MHALAIFAREYGQDAFDTACVAVVSCSRTGPLLNVFEQFGSWHEPPWNGLGRCLGTEAKLPRRMCTILKEDCSPHRYVSLVLFTCARVAVELVHLPCGACRMNV